MNTIQLLILNIAIIIFLKDELKGGFYLKLWLKYDVTKHIKPFDCYFCLIGWTTILTGLITFDFFLLPLGYLISKLWK
tara:strand:+ start:484 stop:717 length:234 start_codon:yes stop_codon:yes gene_type:complete